MARWQSPGVCSVPMSPTSNLVCFPHPFLEGIVDLPNGREPKLVHVQLLRIRRYPSKPFVHHLSLQVEEPVQPGSAGLGTGESTGRPLETNRSLRDAVSKWTTRRNRAHEAFVEFHHAFRYGGQVPTHAPLVGGIHRTQDNGRRQGASPRMIGGRGLTATADQQRGQARPTSPAAGTSADAR